MNKPDWKYTELPKHSKQHSQADTELTELETLAQGSKGESRFSGYRGLIPDEGQQNHESFTLEKGLESFNPARDQQPAGVENGQRERARQESDSAQRSLDESGGHGTEGRADSRTKITTLPV